VHPSLVSRVFHGKARSARVEAALAEALGELESARATGRRKSSSIPPSGLPDRSRELAWLARHRERYGGQWVALDGDRLISSGADARKVFAAAQRAGVPHPLIHLVEPADALPFAGW